MNRQSYDLTEWLEQIRSNEHYNSIQQHIDAKGCIEVKYKDTSVNVFTAEMALFLVSSEVKCKTHPQGEEITINGTDYIEAFVKAYDSGKLEFATIQTGSYTELQNPSSQLTQYYKEQYFVSGYNSLQGWNFVQHFFPYILSKTGVAKYGKYSGCVSAFYDFLSLRPRLQTAIFSAETKEPSNKPNPTHFQCALLAHYTSEFIMDPQNKDEFSARDFLEKYNDKVARTGPNRFYSEYYTRLRTHENRCNFKQPNNLLRDLEKVEPLIEGDVNAMKLLYTDKVELLKMADQFEESKKASEFLQRLYN